MFTSHFQSPWREHHTAPSPSFCCIEVSLGKYVRILSSPPLHINLAVFHKNKSITSCYYSDKCKQTQYYYYKTIHFVLSVFKKLALSSCIYRIITYTLY